MAKGELIGYDDTRKVWCVQQGGRWYPLHCGEAFHLRLGSTWLPCRLELDSTWYVVTMGTKLRLHAKTKYTVRT